MLNWPKLVPSEPPNERMARVFAWASGIFIWTADIDSWNVPEFWPLRSELEARYDRGVIHEDCDGFAMLCRYALWDLEIPNRILTCNVEHSAAAPAPDGDHCVLTAEGTGMVFDCRQPRLVPREELEQLGYTWCSMSGLTGGDPWTEIAPK